MLLSMYARFNLMRRDGDGGYVPMGQEEVESLSIGGFMFQIGNKLVPFDWTAQSGNWMEDGSLEFRMGYGLVNDFELDSCFEDDYKELGIDRLGISAPFLASVSHIEEFYASFDVRTEDGLVEDGVGDNFDKNGLYKIELLDVRLVDMYQEKEYPVRAEVLEAFNQGEGKRFERLIVDANERAGNSTDDVHFLDNSEKTID